MKFMLAHIIIMLHNNYQLHAHCTILLQ